MEATGKAIGSFKLTNCSMKPSNGCFFRYLFSKGNKLALYKIKYGVTI